MRAFHEVVARVLVMRILVILVPDVADFVIDLLVVGGAPDLAIMYAVVQYRWRRLSGCCTACGAGLHDSTSPRVAMFVPAYHLVCHRGCSLRFK
jgi:hypothetical protein